MGHGKALLRDTLADILVGPSSRAHASKTLLQGIFAQNHHLSCSPATLVGLVSEHQNIVVLPEEMPLFKGDLHVVT